MPFTSINRQFPTLATFVAYLRALPLPTWDVIGSTGHNTYRPTEAQWVGKASMLSMQAGYVKKGWTAGPHLFIALGAPNPAHDGIWVMTPPISEGIHGVTCNPTHFGIELVGDFQDKPPSPAQQALFLDAIAALHRYARLGPIFNMHRDCVPRTCPGDAFYALKPKLQAGLAARLAPPAPIPDPLKAELLPGPSRTTIYCSTGAAGLYTTKGGLSFFGYPIKDEFRATGTDGRLCSVLPCERAVIKSVLPEGTHLALLSEAIRERWI